MLWGILGAIVVILLGFVFWFELQSHALGSAGKAEIVQISSGETVSSVASQLSDQQVIGSTLAFRLYNVVHSSPSLTPGSYLFHQNLTFAQVHTILDGGPNIDSVRVDAGLTLHEVAIRVGQLPGHSASTFEQLARQRVGDLNPVARRGRTISKGSWARGPTGCFPGRPTPRC